MRACGSVFMRETKKVCPNGMLTECRKYNRGGSTPSLCWKIQSKSCIFFVMEEKIGRTRKQQRDHEDRGNVAISEDEQDRGHAA